MPKVTQPGRLELGPEPHSKAGAATVCLPGAGPLEPLPAALEMCSWLKQCSLLESR